MVLEMLEAPPLNRLLTRKTTISSMLMGIIKGDDEIVNIEPQRIDLINKILNLLSSTEKRTDVSEWAVNIFEDDSLRIKDSITLKYLKLLGAVDLPSTDRDYLYTDDDFLYWISELKN
ncbi:MULTISPECIES: hypothetical protein [Enterobacterales]|uniref:hypothetical protein n=1 Tax=Enterobacterales TaxID=91347 RepID=UPI002ED893F8